MLFSGPAQAGPPVPVRTGGPGHAAGAAPPAHGLDFASLVGLALGRCEGVGVEVAAAPEASPATPGPQGGGPDAAEDVVDDVEAATPFDAPVDAMTLSVLIALSTPVAPSPIALDAAVEAPGAAGGGEITAPIAADALAARDASPAGSTVGPAVASPVPIAGPAPGEAVPVSGAGTGETLPRATAAAPAAPAAAGTFATIVDASTASSEAAASAPERAESPVAIPDVDAPAMPTATDAGSGASAPPTAAAAATATSDPAASAPALASGQAAAHAAAPASSPDRPAPRAPTAAMRATLAAVAPHAPASRPAHAASAAAPAGAPEAAIASTPAAALAEAASAAQPSAHARVERAEATPHPPHGHAVTGAPAFRGPQHDAGDSARGGPGDDVRQGLAAVRPIEPFVVTPAAGSTAPAGPGILPMAVIAPLSTAAPLSPIELAIPARFGSTMAALDPDTQNLQAMVRTVRLFAGADGVSEARLSLAPDHLGPVALTVRVEQGSVTAHFRAETPAAQRWIETHQHELRSGLREQGLEVKDVLVTTDPDGRRDRRQDAPAPQPRPRRPQGRPDADAPRFEVHV